MATTQFKPVQYHLEVYEPGTERGEVIVSYSASQPFQAISVGDVLTLYREKIGELKGHASRTSPLGRRRPRLPQGHVVHGEIRMKRERKLSDKMRDPAFARQYVRDEISRAAYEKDRLVYEAVKTEMGAVGDGLLLCPESLSVYEATRRPYFVKFKSPEQEAEFNKRLDAKRAEK